MSLSSKLSEQLFLIEFLVHKVHLRKELPECEEGCECPRANQGEPLRVRVKFIDFPCVEINQSEFSDAAEAAKPKDEKKQEQRNEDPGMFASGKSMLFPMPPYDLIRAILHFPLAVTVMLRPKGKEEHIHVLGVTQVPLSEEMRNTVRKVNDCEQLLPISSSLKDAFDLVNMDGEYVGYIVMLVRLSCFGQSIVTQFQLTQEHSYLFRNTRPEEPIPCDKCEERLDYDPCTYDVVPVAPMLTTSRDMLCVPCCEEAREAAGPFRRRQVSWRKADSSDDSAPTPMGVGSLSDVDSTAFMSKASDHHALRAGSPRPCSCHRQLPPEPPARQPCLPEAPDEEAECGGGGGGGGTAMYPPGLGEPPPPPPPPPQNVAPEPLPPHVRQMTRPVTGRPGTVLSVGAQSAMPVGAVAPIGRTLCPQTGTSGPSGVGSVAQPSYATYMSAVGNVARPPIAVRSTPKVGPVFGGRGQVGAVPPAPLPPGSLNLTPDPYAPGTVKASKMTDWHTPPGPPPGGPPPFFSYQLPTMGITALGTSEGTQIKPAYVAMAEMRYPEQGPPCPGGQICERPYNYKWPFIADCCGKPVPPPCMRRKVCCKPEGCASSEKVRKGTGNCGKPQGCGSNENVQRKIKGNCGKPEGCGSDEKMKKVTKGDCGIPEGCGSNEDLLQVAKGHCGKPEGCGSNENLLLMMDRRERTNHRTGVKQMHYQISEVSWYAGKLLNRKFGIDVTREKQTQGLKLYEPPQFLSRKQAWRSTIRAPKPRGRGCRGKVPWVLQNFLNKYAGPQVFGPDGRLRAGSDSVTVLHPPRPLSRRNVAFHGIESTKEKPKSCNVKDRSATGAKSRGQPQKREHELDPKPPNYIDVPHRGVLSVSVNPALENKSTEPAAAKENTAEARTHSQSNRPRPPSRNRREAPRPLTGQGNRRVGSAGRVGSAIKPPQHETFFERFGIPPPDRGPVRGAEPHTTIGESLPDRQATSPAYSRMRGGRDEQASCSSSPNRNRTESCEVPAGPTPNPHTEKSQGEVSRKVVERNQQGRWDFKRGSLMKQQDATVFSENSNRKKQGKSKSPIPVEDPRPRARFQPKSGGTDNMIVSGAQCGGPGVRHGSPSAEGSGPEAGRRAVSPEGALSGFRPKLWSGEVRSIPLGRGAGPGLQVVTTGVRRVSASSRVPALLPRGASGDSKFGAGARPRGPPDEGVRHSSATRGVSAKPRRGSGEGGGGGTRSREPKTGLLASGEGPDVRRGQGLAPDGRLQGGADNGCCPGGGAQHYSSSPAGCGIGRCGPGTCRPPPELPPPRPQKSERDVGIPCRDQPCLWRSRAKDGESEESTESMTREPHPSAFDVWQKRVIEGRLKRKKDIASVPIVCHGTVPGAGGYGPTYAEAYRSMWGEELRRHYEMQVALERVAERQPLSFYMDPQTNVLHMVEQSGGGGWAAPQGGLEPPGISRYYGVGSVQPGADQRPEGAYRTSVSSAAPGMPGQYAYGAGEYSAQPCAMGAGDAAYGPTVRFADQEAQGQEAPGNAPYPEQESHFDGQEYDWNVDESEEPPDPNWLADFAWGGTVPRPVDLHVNPPVRYDTTGALTSASEYIPLAPGQLLPPRPDPNPPVRYDTTGALSDAFPLQRRRVPKLPRDIGRAVQAVKRGRRATLQQLLDMLEQLQNSEKQPKYSRFRPSRKYDYNWGARYPGTQFGHHECVPHGRRVPGRKGWNWDGRIASCGLKPRPGWRPGAICKSLAKRVRAAPEPRKPFGLSAAPRPVTTLQRARIDEGGPSNDDVERGDDDFVPTPTLHVHRFDGDFYVSMHPGELSGTTENIPLQFRIINKDKGKEPPTCEDSASELEIELFQPGAFKTGRKELANNRTQYDEADFPFVPPPPPPPPAADKKKKKKGKKGKGKGKGKGKKGKKK